VHFQSIPQIKQASTFGRVISHVSRAGKKYLQRPGGGRPSRRCNRGFTFAPHPVVADTDRDKWAVLRIVDFYRRQPTDYADYFIAAWRYQHRAGLGLKAASLAQVARESKVSPKYLALIWSTLTERKEEVGPYCDCTMWRALPAPNSGHSSSI